MNFSSVNMLLAVKQVRTKKRLCYPIFFYQHCWVCFKEKVNRPFARSGHTVQNYIYWWASCVVGLPKQCTCLTVYSHGRKMRGRGAASGTWMVWASWTWKAWASAGRWRAWALAGRWRAWASAGRWMAWASWTWKRWASGGGGWPELLGRGKHELQQGGGWPKLLGPGLFELQGTPAGHLCPGLNAITNFASFTIFRFSFKFNKFCDFSLNSTRYTKIRCLNDFSVRCAEIFNFMLTDQQAPACRFYKIYKIYDFSISHCKICDFLHFFVMQIPCTSADLRILQNLRFFAANNKTQEDR